jgi:hypothetical protein
LFATPRTPQQSDGFTKEDLLNELIVIQVDDYDPNTPTKYGPSATLLGTVTVVTGELAGVVEPRFYCAGNLARQIGEALDVGSMAPGRIIKGQSANGRDWFGIEWATERGDLEAAEKAIRTAQAPAAPRVAPTPTPPVAPRPMALGDQARDTVRSLKQRAQQATATGDDAPF